MENESRLCVVIRAVNKPVRLKTIRTSSGPSTHRSMFPCLFPKQFCLDERHQNAKQSEKEGGNSSESRERRGKDRRQ